MQFDTEYDAVVIGSGSAGKSAAYTFATESDMSVAVLEKMADFGGTSRYTEGVGAIQSSEVKARKQPDYPLPELPEGAHFPTHLEAIEALMNGSHFRANPDVVREYVYGSAETIDVLKSIGVKFTDVTIYALEQEHELYAYHAPEGLGARIHELQMSACENAGVDFFASTKAERLICEDGKVVGIVATDSDGNELNIGAKAVVIASGGYGDNAELVKKWSFFPHITETAHSYVEKFNTGDGILMAQDAGAYVDCRGALMMGTTLYNHSTDSDVAGVALQPALYVDSRGHRFTNEAVAHSFQNLGYVVGMLPDGICWTVVDADQVNHYETEGGDIAWGIYVELGANYANFESQAEAFIEQGDPCVVKAETIVELAEKMGCNPQDLEDTIEKYNTYCDEGADTQYFKPAKYLRAVKKAPFYAIRTCPELTVSIDGVKVNGNFQAVDEFDHPVPGLYVAGNDATGLYGDTYTLDVPTVASGFAHTSGRLAARHAMEEIQG